MSNVSMEAVATVVGQIYEAAYDQERWLDAVLGVRDLFGASRSCIVRLQSKTLGAVASEVDPDLNSQAAIEVLLRDPLILASADIPAGKVTQWGAMMGEAAFRRSEIWQDWFKPRDMYHALMCNLLPSHQAYCVFNVHRGANQTPFDANDSALLQKLVPHLMRAGQIGRKLEGMSALSSAFSHLPFGVFLVDANQHIVQMNGAADLLLANPNSPLQVKAGKLSAVRPADSLDLQRLVAGICAWHEGLPETSGTLLVSSHSGEAEAARLVLSVSPVPSARAYGLAPEPCALVMVNELAGSLSDGFEAQVGRLFGLTPSEGRLAAALATGYSLKEAAARLDITVKTSRTYLERIFAKTGTHQQSQLVAILKSAEPFSGSIKPNC